MKDPLLDNLRKQEEGEDILEVLEAQLEQENPTKLYRLLRDDWESSTINSTSDSIRLEVWQKLEEVIAERAPVEKEKPLIKKWMPYLRKIVLPLVGLVIITLIFNLIASSKDTPKFGKVYKENKTVAAQKLDLGGNLIAWLGKGSELNYDRSLVGSPKFAKLSGEAFFEMSPDSNKAFQIEAGPLIIEALGAKLDIEALENSKQVRVFIQEGEATVKPKNKLDHEPSRLVLGPGDQLRYNCIDHYSTVYQTNESSIKGVLAWRNEEAIAFNHHTLETAFLKLENYFDVNIEYDPDAIRDCYTNIGPNPIVYDKDYKLERILTSLLKKKKLKFEKKDGKFVITGKGC